MSKVISFSISDRYLDKLRTLYPALTDNLAVKQFVTDGLDSSLGNSLDVSLDDGLDDKLKTLIESSLSSSLDDTLDDVLDDKLKTIIETSLDGILDERLDAVMGKLLTSLSERLSRLEERLDDSLDGRLDDMKRLLRLQQSASIATSPLPPSPPDRPAIGTVTPEVPPSPPGTDAIASIDGTVESVNTSPLPPNQETVETADTVESDSIGEPVEPAIGPVPGDSSHLKNQLSEGMNAAEAYRYLTAKGVKVSEKTLSNWVKIKQIPVTGKGDAVSKYLILKDGLYYPNPD